jgi:hypothetical protein
MNKLLRTLIFVSASALALNGFAATGFFGNTFVVADGSTFYEITNNTANPKLSDGFGNLLEGGSFNIQGFELNTFEDNGSEITHMNLFWTVDDFTNTHQIQIFPAPTKSGNDRFWQITSGTQNLLNNNGVGSLAQGNYTFKAYFEGYTNANNTPGNIFLNNGGADYSAGFTVIPEPSSIIMLGLTGLAAGGIALLKRRKRA